MKKVFLALSLAIGLGTMATPAMAADSAPGAPATPPVWTAQIEPSGTDQDAPTVTTSGACPAPARSIVGRIYGAGFPSEGMNVIGNSSGGVSQEGPFKAPLQQSLRDTRNQMPKYTPYTGTYTITVYCIVQRFPNQPYGEYTVKISFSDPQTWKALPPPSTAAGPIRLPNGTYVPADSQQAKDYANGSPAPSPSAGASASAAAGQPTTGPSNATTPAAQPVKAAHHSGAPWGAIGLIAAGVVIAVGTLIFFRRNSSTP